MSNMHMAQTPAPVVDFDPFWAPGWVQPYLDCVSAIVATGVGGRRARLEMYRGTCKEDAVLVGVVEVDVPKKEGR